MSKITLSTVSELQAFPSAAANINSNSATIEDAFDNTLSRDGTSPNSMGAALDMNSHRVVNLPAPISSTEPLRAADLTGGSAVTVNNLPTAGTINQVLTKNSSTNYDVSWAGAVNSIAGNTGLFTLSNGITNSTNDIRLNVGQLPGEPSTGSATAGNIGEYITGTNTAVPLTTATPLNVVSIVLTAGDWDVSCNTRFYGVGTTSVTNTASSLSTTSVTLNTAIGSYATNRVPASLDYQCSHCIGPTRFSVSGSTTVYLVVQATFTAAIYSVDGILRARRVR
jgi:hypothetical protein